MSDGYLGNQHLKKTGISVEWTPEQIQEYVKCASDPIYFAKKYIKIVHVDKGLVPFDMYPYQEEIVEKINRSRRVAVLTARQSGKTTTAVAIILHYILFNEYKTAAILANKGDAAREVLSRIQLAYEALPKWLQQGVLEWNKGSIELENGCKVYAGTTSSSAIRGKSISFLYLDECITENNKVCVEISNDHYYYSEIGNFINIDESKFIKVKESDQMLYTVYKTTNKINKKEYIGFHKVKNKSSILSHFSESGSIFTDGYMGSGKLMKKALVKYGPENFEQELLFSSNDIDETFDVERELVDEKYYKRDDTYNLTIGGKNCVFVGSENSFFGKKHTNETIRKIQESRNGTIKANPFTWCETYDKKTNEIFFTYDEIFDHYNIKDGKNIDVYLLCYYGILDYKSDFLRSVATKRAEEYISWISETEKRKKMNSEIVSKRFSGVPKTTESNIKRSNSMRKWIQENPEKHKSRMDAINKNQEKIRKTADKHRGMKRSDETKNKISEAKRGQTPPNKDTIKIFNALTGDIKNIESTDTIPNGWERGTGGTGGNGPKGKKVFHNPITGEMKFFYEQDVPTDWVKGRKK